MICDACNVRPEFKGEHRCHSPSGDTIARPFTVNGVSFFGNCECAQCRVPTQDEIRAILDKANSNSTE